MRKRLLHGPALKAIRTRTGVPAGTFAVACGITPGYLSNIEAGRKQPADALMSKMAAELGLSLHDVTYVVSAEATTDEDLDAAA